MAKQSIQAVPVKEVVTDEVLRIAGLNAHEFSGDLNPSGIWQTLQRGGTDVFPHYRKLYQMDIAVNSGFQTRKLLVLARDWQVTGADDSNGEAVRIQEETSAFLESIPGFGFSLSELLDAPAFGYAVSEIMWENSGDQISASKIIGRPQQLFRFGKDILDPQVGDLYFLPSGISSDATTVDQVKFLVNSFDPQHGDRRGSPLLKKLFWASWFKRQCLRLNLQFVEKGQGTVVVVYPTGASDEEKKLAQECAQAIAGEAAVAVPKGFEVVPELLTNARTRQADDYQTLIGRFDLEITRLILGQTLTTHGSDEGRGTQALGNVHQNLMYEIIKRDAKGLDDVVNDQLLTPWGLWTFGEKFLDRAVRPTFAINLMPEEDAMGWANLLSKSRGMVDIPERFAREKLQIPAPDKDEALIKESMFPIDLGGGLGGGFGGAP